MVDKKTAAAHFAGLPDGDSLEPVHMVLRAHPTHLPGRWLPISLWLLACGGLVVAININLRSANQRANEAADALANASLRTDADRSADASTPDSNPADEQASTPPAVERENPFEQSDAPVPESELDRLVISRLEVLGIEPAAVCSDAVFLRRVYLDTIGTLPTATEAKEFLDSTAPDKRRHLIDALLERPEFADYWAMKWCDVLRVKAEFPINLWPNAAQAYHRWIHSALRDNMPFDQFARELLISSGSNFRTPQVNFYRAMQGRDPDEIAAIVALTFMGERVEHWPPGDVQRLAVFFSQISFKPTGEWKEEIVIFDPRRAQLDPDQKDLTAVLPDGSEVMLPDGVDPRTVFADWLIDDRNPRFVYPVVNRIWHWLLGRGIVDPPDDFHAGNPPRNLLLLDYLAAEFAAAEYDLKHLYRVILNSATYQRSCLAAHADSEESSAEFASYHVRRLDAEVLIDAICQITGTTETYSSMIPEPFTFLPDNQRAIALPDGSITSSFLEMFGRPARDTGMESERNNRLTARQALHLLNSNHIRQKIEEGPGLQAILDSGFRMSEIIDNMYLTVLSRRPTAEERDILNYLQLQEHGYKAFVWSLINSDEFLFRH